MVEVDTVIDIFTPEAITIEDIRQYCRVDNTTDDVLLTNITASSQSEALGFTHIVFGTATFSITIYGMMSVFNLPYTPYASMVTFEIDGEASTEYSVEGSKVFITASDYEQINFTYNAAGTQPADVKQAILQRTKFAYDYPDDMVYEKPRYFERVLTRYRAPSSFV